jgi:hypothetical protein
MGVAQEGQEEPVNKAEEDVALRFVKNKLEATLLARAAADRTRAPTEEYLRMVFRARPSAKDEGEVLGRRAAREFEEHFKPEERSAYVVAGDRKDVEDEARYRRVVVTFRPPGTPADGELVLVLLVLGERVVFAYRTPGG